MKKFLSIVLSMVLVLSLVACSNKPNQPTTNPSTNTSNITSNSESTETKEVNIESAADLMKAVRDNENNSKLHINDTMDVYMSLKLEANNSENNSENNSNETTSDTTDASNTLDEFSDLMDGTEVTLKFENDMDKYGNKYHGKATTSDKIDSEDNLSDNVEYYIDDNNIYMYSENNKTWAKLSSKSTVIPGYTVYEVVDSKLNFSKASLEFDNNFGTYNVYGTFGDMLSDEDIKSIITLNNEITNENEEENYDYSKSIEDYKATTVSYIIDKEYNLMSVAIDQMNTSESSDFLGSNLVLTMNMTINVLFSNHGNIDTTTIDVPSDVVESAISEEEYNQKFGGDYGDYTMGEQVDPEKLGNDVYGNYNGSEIKVGMDWKTFEKDGFTMQEYYEDIGAVIFESPDKYPESYIQIFDKGGKKTLESFEKDGIFGYDVRVDLKKDKLPPFKFSGGITFGSTQEEIKEVYGEPSYEYHSNSGDYWTLEYHFTNGIILAFSNTLGEPGINNVVMNYFTE